MLNSLTTLGVCAALLCARSVSAGSEVYDVTLTRDASDEDCNDLMYCESLGPVCGDNSMTYTNPCHAECESGGFATPRSSCEGEDEAYIADGTGTARLGEPCVFPFKFLDIEYDACIVDTAFPQGWCGTTYDVDMNQELGGCTLGSILELDIVADEDLVPLSCAPGSYLSDTWLVLNCQLCEPGTYSPIEGTTECLVCPVGSAAGSIGARNCDRCKAGSYASKNKTLECGVCGVDTYAAAAGATKCVPCEAGTTAPEGATRCFPITSRTLSPSASPSSSPTASPEEEEVEACVTDAQSSVPFIITTAENKEKKRRCLTAHGDVLTANLESCYENAEAEEESQYWTLSKVTVSDDVARTLTKQTYQIQWRGADDGKVYCLSKSAKLSVANINCESFTFMATKGDLNIRPSSNDKQCMKMGNSYATGKTLKVSTCAGKSKELFRVQNVLEREFNGVWTSQTS